MLKGKNLIRILCVMVAAIMFFGTLTGYALDLEVYIAGDNFDDIRELTVKNEGNVSTEIVTEEDGNKVLCYRTTASNSSWSSCVNFNVTAGNTSPVGKIKFRMRLDESVSSNSVMFGVLNNPISVTKEWKQFEIKVSGNYTTANIQCPGANIVAYVDDVELYSVLKNIQEPAVESSIPEDGGSCAPSDFVTVTFNNPMGESALEAQNYILEGGAQTVVSVEKTGDKTYKVCFSDVLSELADYSLTISGLSDAYGQVMSDGVIEFSTSEYMKPSVISLVPESGCYGVVSGDAIEITYDQNVSVDNAMVELSETAEYEISVSENVVVITLNELLPNTAYKLHLSGVENAKGKIAEDIDFDFITSAEKTLIYSNTFSVSDDAGSSNVAGEHCGVSYAPGEGYQGDGALLASPSQYGQISLRKNGVAVNLEAGKTYKYSFLIKGTNSVKIWLMDGRYNNTIYSEKNIGTEYTQFSYTFTETEEVKAPYIQFAAAVECYIDNVEIEEVKAAELVNSSDLFTEDNVELGEKILTFVFNKALDQSSISNSSVKLNGTAIPVVEKGENFFSVNLGDKVESGCDYTVSMSIRDEDGMTVNLTRDFSWIVAVRCELKTEKKNGKFVLSVENIENTSDKAQNVTSILILYKDGRMIDGMFKEVTLSAGGQLSDDLTLEMETSDCEAYGYLWDSIRTRKAFVPAVHAK